MSTFGVENVADCDTRNLQVTFKKMLETDALGLWGNVNANAVRPVPRLLSNMAAGQDAEQGTVSTRVAGAEFSNSPEVKQRHLHCLCVVTG